MALKIRSIPVLTGKVASDFIKKADEAYKNRNTVDFSKEMEVMKRILKKANL